MTKTDTNFAEKQKLYEELEKIVSSCNFLTLKN